MTRNKTIVFAFGGNAITREDQQGFFEEQLENIEKSCGQVLELARMGYRMVITHGNGPQVGSLLIKNDLAKDHVPSMPLYVCVANTQGSIGYAIQQTLQWMLKEAGINREVASIITQVEVDVDDVGFANPTKPIGPFFSESRAQEMMTKEGYAMREDSGRGWRRVVASPQPRGIVEKNVIKALADAGVIVVAVGGGGVPVIAHGKGFQGIEAVIDKDRASQRLASDMGADYLIMLTGVPKVYLDFKKPSQRALDRLTVSEAKEFMKRGHFPGGSMGPKIEASINFVEQGRGTAIITDFESMASALRGENGTRIVSDQVSIPLKRE